MTKEVIELTQELRSVRIALDVVLDRLSSIDKMARTERRRSRWHRAGSGLVFALVVAVIALGYREYREQERLERRQCLTVNETRVNTRTAIVESLIEIGRHSPDPERLDVLAAQLGERLDVILPLENCRGVN